MLSSFSCNAATMWCSGTMSLTLIFVDMKTTKTLCMVRGSTVTIKQTSNSQHTLKKLDTFFNGRCRTFIHKQNTEDPLALMNTSGCMYDPSIYKCYEEGSSPTRVFNLYITCMLHTTSGYFCILCVKYSKSKVCPKKKFTRPLA